MKAGKAILVACVWLLAVGGSAVGAPGGERPTARGLRDHRKAVRLRAVETIADAGPKDEDLRALVARPQDEDQEVRTACVAALFKLGPRALPALIEALGGPDLELRGSAAEVLGQLGPAATGALPLLIAAAGEDDERLRRQARVSIGKIGIKALPEAVSAFYEAALITSDGEIRELWSALEEEANAMVAAALAPLVEALEAHDGAGDRDRAIRGLASALLGFVRPRPRPWPRRSGIPQGVRDVAAESLVKLGTPGVAALAQALRDPYKDARLAAVRGLASGGELAVPVLVEALADPELGQDLDLRKEVVEALGRIGSGHEEAVASLERMVADPDQGVAVAAVRALGNFGAAAVRVLLEKLGHPTEAVRNEVSEALGRIGSPAVPALLELLRDHDRARRLAALSVLIKLGDKATPAVPALLEALEDKDAMIRQAAVYALDHIGSLSGEVVPSLLRLLHDDSERVRRIAERLLSRVDPEAARAAALGQGDEDEDEDVPTRVDRVDIVEYGLYGADVYLKTGAGSLVSVLDTEHLRTTQDIPAELGTTFGLRWVVRGTPHEREVPVRVRVLHPPFRKAGSDQPLADQWDSKPSIGETLYTSARLWRYVWDERALPGVLSRQVSLSVVREKRQLLWPSWLLKEVLAPVRETPAGRRPAGRPDACGSAGVLAQGSRREQGHVLPPLAQRARGPAGSQGLREAGPGPRQDTCPIHATTEGGSTCDLVSAHVYGKGRWTFAEPSHPRVVEKGLNLPELEPGRAPSEALGVTPIAHLVAESYYERRGTTTQG